MKEKGAFGDFFFVVFMLSNTHCTRVSAAVTFLCVPSV